MPRHSRQRRRKAPSSSVTSSSMSLAKSAGNSCEVAVVVDLGSGISSLKSSSLYATPFLSSFASFLSSFRFGSLCFPLLYLYEKEDAAAILKRHLARRDVPLVVLPAVPATLFPRH